MNQKAQQLADLFQLAAGINDDEKRNAFLAGYEAAEQATLDAADTYDQARTEFNRLLDAQQAKFDEWKQTVTAAVDNLTHQEQPPSILVDKWLAALDTCRNARTQRNEPEDIITCLDIDRYEAEFRLLHHTWFED